MTRLSRPARALAVPLGVIALLAGCTDSHSAGTRSRPNAMPTSATVYVQTTCSFTAMNTLVPTDPAQRTAMPSATHPGVGHGGAIPPGFTPVALIGCPFAVADATGARIATQTKADSALDDLITAYRMPAPAADIRSGTAVACPAYMDPDPVIAFVDAQGTAVWPAPPRDATCGHISTRVTTALAALHWTVTKSERVATSP